MRPPSEDSPQKRVRAPTLADVGRAAGVSAMAVSAVLNGARTSSRISRETRERILRAAGELNYRPNIAARALAQRRMQTIGIAAVIEDGGALNQYFLEVFNGILSGAAHHGQNTTVFSLHDWNRDAARIAAFCDGRIDGLVLLAPRLTREAAEILPRHTPFVSIHSNVQLPGVRDIESDEEVGIHDLVAELIRLGHRRIVHLTGDPGTIGRERRLRGYTRALTEAGLAVDPALIADAGFQSAIGRDATRRWLEAHRAAGLPDAIVCANDGCAIGCLEALAEAGLRVPDDVSVTGFDDTSAARTTVPQLSSVRQPLRAMAVQAVEELLAKIRHLHGEGPAPSDEPLVFPTEVVLRASVAPPPRARAGA